MDEQMTRWKVALAAFFSALGTMLGWKGIMALAIAGPEKTDD